MPPNKSRGVLRVNGLTSPAGEGEAINLPLTISVFTPLTLGRHPAAGRLPFGALAPEVGWVWQLPR
jgi:hypothetical protein